jgi:hypothetical protein
MRKPSRTGGKPVKARRRKSVTLNRRNALKVTGSRPMLDDALRDLRDLVAAGDKLDQVLPKIARQHGFDQMVLRERWLRAYKSEASVRAFARATAPETALRRPFTPETELQRRQRLQDEAREGAAKRARQEGLEHYWDEYRKERASRDPEYAKRLRKRDREGRQREREEQHARAVREAKRQRKLLKQLGKSVCPLPVIATVRYWDVPADEYLKRLQEVAKISGDGLN